MNYKVLIAATLAAVVAQASTVDESVPEPWLKNGQSPARDECVAGVDPELEQGGTPNLTLKCDSTLEGFVGIMQSFSAENYLDKRLRFSALVKSEGIEGWGGLWMRVDDVGRSSSAFDNMQDRPIKGTTDWAPYSVVLDVSQDAEGIFFGTLMIGNGQLWITNVSVEAVGEDVATTRGSRPTEPGNLELAR